MPSVDDRSQDTWETLRIAGWQAGFTLVEVLVVLAIVGLASVTVAWAMKPLRDRTIVMRTVAAFKSLSEAARARAIENGATVALAIDPRGRTLGIPALDRIERLPPDVAVSWVSASVSGRRSGEASILFLPDGTSTGGRLSARVGDVAAAVRISWVSGAAIDEP